MRRATNYYYAGYQQKKPFPKWLIFVIIGVVLIFGGVIAILIAANIASNNDDVEERERVAIIEQNDVEDGYAYEAAQAGVDELNALYAAEAKKGGHAEYKTGLTGSYTQYFEERPGAICVKLGVSCASLAKPEELAGFKKVTALNTNALSYYLDNGYIVVMKGYGEYPYAKDKSTAVVVYAADYGMGYKFLGFIAPEANKQPMMIELSRYDLINGVTGVPSCYIAKF